MTGHVTSTARPPRAWELPTAVLIIVVAAAVAIAATSFGADLAIRALLQLHGAYGLSPLAVWLVVHSQSIDRVYLLLLFVYIGIYLWWRRITLTVLSRIGETPDAVLRHWAIAGWKVSVVVGFLTTFGWLSSGGGLASFTVLAVLRLVRIVGLTFLLIGVWQIQDRIRRTVAASGVSFSPTAVHATGPTPGTLATAAAIAMLPAADDDFWSQVRQLATGLGAEVAMLETTDAQARRWWLIPEDGNLAAVRAGVSAGSVVTVFTEPPAATATKDYTPAPAELYYGLLQDSPGAAASFQPVRPFRIAKFLARAGQAHRWGLYHPSDPTALTAVVPQPEPLVGPAVQDRAGRPV